MSRRLVVVGDRVAVLGFVLSVEDQRDAELQRELRAEVLLSENERLERMQQVLNRQPGEELHHLAVLIEADVVEAAHVQPRLEVLPADFGVENRRPCDRQRVHAVLVLQDMRLHAAILAAAAGDEAVIRTVLTPVLVEQREQLLFAFLPVDLIFDVAEAAGVTDSFFVDGHRPDLAIGRVLEFRSRCGALVRDHAALAVGDFLGQTVVSGQGLNRHVDTPLGNGVGK